MSLWRSCCLLDGCSETCCLQKTICIIAVLLITVPGCVWLGVVRLNLPIIYSYIVIFLGQFGILSIGGLASLRSSLLRCRIILINLVLVVVSQRCAAQYHKSFGLQQFGKFGKKEITCFLIYKESSVIQVIDKIKSLAFRWLKAKFVTLPFNYHGWWLSPFTMLDIG